MGTELFCNILMKGHHRLHVVCLLRGHITKLLLSCLVAGSVGRPPSTKAKQVKPKGLKASLTTNSNKGDPDASSEGAAGRKLPRAQTAYLFFMADKRAGFKGKDGACGSMTFALPGWHREAKVCLYVPKFSDCHTRTLSAAWCRCCQLHAEAHPALTTGEITKQLSQMWKDLSEADKNPYNVSSYAVLPHAS